MLVEAGSKLSQGQKQLLSLARALLHRSKLILMDEVTSSIDSVSEALLFKVLHNHISRNPDAVLIIISHKLDAIKRLCNKVIRFNDDNVSLEDL
jgi:ABC-type multidrug transport system fused ATPase/permease subunit